MNKLLYFLKRVLFGLPLGLTLEIVRRKLTGGKSTASAAAAAPKAHLPIDALYGIDTSGVIQASALRTGSSADLYSSGYGASIPSVIRQAIETCPDLEKAAFVDVGCGKGLPLAVASEYPFRKIVGVELSPTLCEVARENAARIATRFPERTAIEITEIDATTFEFPAGYVIIYLYHPCYPRLLDRLAARMAEHQAAGNKVMVIYANPVGAKSFDRRPVFQRYFAACLEFDEAESAASPFGNSSDSIAIWQGVGEPMFTPLPGADAEIRISANGSCTTVQPA